MSILSRLGRAFGQGEPVEQKSLAQPDDRLLGIFDIQPVASGVTVSASTAMRVPAVACAVGLISETCGALPVKLYDRASRETAKDHPAYGLIHDDANDWTSAEELREALTLDALMHGHGFAQVVRNGEGKPMELHRIAPAAVTLDTEDGGEPRYKVRLQGGGEAILPYSDMLHVPAFGGVSPISLAKEAIGLAIAAEQHLTGFYSNGGRPSGIIKHPAKLDAAAAAKIAASWFTSHGGKQAGGTAVLDEAMDYQQVSGTHTDAQFLENRLEQVREIARAFRIPPTMLFELSRGTWSNTEEMGRQFLTMTLRPWLKRWQAGYARCLLSPEDRARFYIEAVTDDLLTTDFASRATAYGQYRSMGAMTANEVRGGLNLPPMAEGDKLDNPYISTGATAPAKPQDNEQ
ncbi:phage portal protein [Paracoccus sp. YLB-12]|uniref:Phage portal protein n=1 Tax=Paracoccus maritimus TaxID=2933292 RepID=A0ABT2K8A2_9RHOB|nr:phage portal protein [Paracoccus sp. YLB-12]MCT4332616.1 phage portal protein [Paracoccus sp. YLB-12]